MSGSNRTNVGTDDSLFGLQGRFSSTLKLQISLHPFLDDLQAVPPEVGLVDVNAKR
jgi:hypothetical protein